MECVVKKTLLFFVNNAAASLAPPYFLHYYCPGVAMSMVFKYNDMTFLFLSEQLQMHVHQSSWQQDRPIRKKKKERRRDGHFLTIVC